MTLKDRGTKKWTAMMLPEQVEMVKELWLEDEMIDRPVLDEYQLQEIDQKINTAAEYKLPMEFELWVNGFVEEVQGVISNVDAIGKKLWVQDIKGELHIIDQSDLVGVEFAD